MPFKIIRNDIAKLDCDAIVNKTDSIPAGESGYEFVIRAASEGKTFFTYREQNPEMEEEEKLRFYYQKGLTYAWEKKISSIAFLLISFGNEGYSKEEGMRIAVDEISSFLEDHEMMVYIVVPQENSVKMANDIYSELQDYIFYNYEGDVDDDESEDIDDKSSFRMIEFGYSAPSKPNFFKLPPEDDELSFEDKKVSDEESSIEFRECCEDFGVAGYRDEYLADAICEEGDFSEKYESELADRISHMSDTFSEYLLYLIERNHLTNAEVYKRAIVDKKVFSKIKNNPDYHPQKMTAMCLCIGAKLNLDESKDLLARAGYALSPCDKTDVIFSFFIENEIYDMIELDIQLEEHGLRCLIS